MPIVSILNNQVLTTSTAVAAGTDRDHASVLKIIRKYVTDLEQFGRVRFEIVPFKTGGGTQKREIAYLNERQATLLFTYMRNNEKVRAFKIKLVKEFYRLAESQNKPQIELFQEIDPRVIKHIDELSTRIALETKAKIVKNFTEMAIERQKLYEPTDVIEWLGLYNELAKPVVLLRKDFHTCRALFAALSETVEDVREILNDKNKAA